jgi:glycosyltransferase involved in cell wall biosynthesis
MKIAIVVQRYGLEVSGGAELAARYYAEHLSKYHNVEVITTTANDYFTWNPYYKAGKDEINGIGIHRFDVDKPRNMFTFDLMSKYIFHFPRPDFMEEVWMRAQGPYSSALFDYLKNSKDDYDIFIFFTYLFATTYFGLPLVREKAILAPTAHDEAPIKLKIYKDFFQQPLGFIYLTEEEMKFLNDLYGTSEKPGIITGVGIDVSDSLDPEAAFGEFPALKDKDYIIFVGRITSSKGVNLLIEMFKKYIEQTGKDLYLALVGKSDFKIPADPRIIHTGFVSEEVKLSLIKNARILVNSSRFESLSIVLLESWLMETPVLVNEKCAVTNEQVRLSGGGLAYSDQGTFNKALDTLLNNQDTALKMAKSGKKFVLENYSWKTIEEKINGFLSEITGKT